MRKIAIILGHPKSAADTLCHALADAYLEGAKSAGHEVSLIEIATLDMGFLTGHADHKNVGLSQDMQAAQDVLGAADHWVIIYPLWLGTMPAKLKAFMEWVFEPDFAFGDTESKWPQGKLKGKTAHIVITMGMPGFAYRLFFGAHSLKSLQRNILKFIGIKPTKTTIHGMVENVTDEKRQKWIAAMKECGRRVA